MIAPGVIGAIALVLALFAMHILPVNFAGLLLIVVALGFFLLEAKYTSHGVLALGGVVAMMLGALMLIRSPLTGAGVSLGAALGVTLPCAVITILLMRLVLRSRSWKQSTGAEQLLGAEAEVTEAIAPPAEVALGTAATPGAAHWALLHRSPEPPMEAKLQRMAPSEEWCACAANSGAPSPRNRFRRERTSACCAPQA